MLSCLEWCTSLFNCGGQEPNRRGRPRRRGANRRFGAEEELIGYAQLGLEEEAVEVEQVAEAARIAERKQVAPALRDESLIARLTHSLNAMDSSNVLAPMASSSAADEDVDDELPKILNSTAFVKTLHALDNAKVRAIVVEGLWNATRHRWRKRETTRLLALYQIAISCSLGPASQQELYSIILDLPPAVMGDTQAQEISRVLIDVSRDAREEMMRKRAELPISGRSQVDSAVAAFDAPLKQIELQGAGYQISHITLRCTSIEPFKLGSVEPHIALYFDVLISLLLELEEFDRFRILMSQILLSKQVPADTTLRASVLELVFPSRPSTPSNLQTALLISNLEEITVDSK